MTDLWQQDSMTQGQALRYPDAKQAIFDGAAEGRAYITSDKGHVEII